MNAQLFFSQLEQLTSSSKLMKLTPKARNQQPANQSQPALYILAMRMQRHTQAYCNQLFLFSKQLFAVCQSTSRPLLYCIVSAGGWWVKCKYKRIMNHRASQQHPAHQTAIHTGFSRPNSNALNCQQLRGKVSKSPPIPAINQTKLNHIKSTPCLFNYTDEAKA